MAATIQPTQPTIFTNLEPDTAKSFSQTFVEFFKTKDIWKIFYYCTQWFSRFMSIPQEVAAAGSFAGDIKNSISIANSPGELQEACEAVGKAYRSVFPSQETLTTLAEDIGAALRTVVRKVTAFINSACDGLKLVSKFFFLPMREINGVSDAATLVGSCSNLVDDVGNMCNLPESGDVEETARNQQKRLLYTLNIGQSVSYGAVGAMGVYTFMTGVALSWALAPLTVALLLNITTHFFKNLVDPEQKNQSLDRLREKVRQLTPIATAA